MVKLICHIFSTFALASCNLLLWGSKKLELPALKHYTTESFRNVIRDLGNPAVAVFETDFSRVPTSVLRTELQLRSSYLPNTDINFTEFKVIEHNNDVDIVKEMYDAYEDPLIVFEQRSKRQRRLIITSYSGELYEDRGYMIYTERPPMLRKESVFYELSDCVKVFANVGVNTVEMAIRFRIAENVTTALEFMLVFLDNEWVLGTVKLTDADGDIFLTPNMKMQMPDGFSFHCSFNAKFKDVESDIEVVFYGIQIQPFCKDERFSPAVECRYYVTPGILSIQLISVMLLTALYIGVNGLINIKTTHKFDNGKMKTLHFEDITN